MWLWSPDLKYDSWWDNKSGNRLIHALLKQENQGPRVSVSDWGPHHWEALRGWDLVLWERGLHFLPWLWSDYLFQRDPSTCDLESSLLLEVALYVRSFFFLLEYKSTPIFLILRNFSLTLDFILAAHCQGLLHSPKILECCPPSSHCCQHSARLLSVASGVLNGLVLRGSPSSHLHPNPHACSALATLKDFHSARHPTCDFLNRMYLCPDDRVCLLSLSPWQEWKTSEFRNLVCVVPCYILSIWNSTYVNGW